jgi:NADP-dependent 3-hydroxy acid dehydrogenase YdfG
VLIASRDRERLSAARSEIITGAGAVDVHSVETYVLDATVESAVADFAAYLEDGAWDGLVVSAAGAAPHGPIGTLATSETRGLFDSKFWTAYHCCKHLAPRLADGGAVALVAGVLNRRPGVKYAFQWTAHSSAAARLTIGVVFPRAPAASRSLL